MKKYNLAIAILIILAFTLLMYDIGKPFWGQFDWTGAWFGTIARNLITIPLEETKLAAITVSGTKNPADWSFYNHYSSFYPMIVALSMTVIGQTETAIRMVSVIFSLLTIYSFFLICRKFLHPLVGIFGLFAVVLTPMFIYYGKLPVHEQPVLFFSLMGVYFYLSWLKVSKKADFIKMVIFLSLAFLTSWTGIYMIFLLSVHLLLSKGKQVFKFLPIYIAVGTIAVLHLLHTVATSDIYEFQSTFFHRTGGGINPINFVLQQLKWFLVLYGRPLALVALFYLGIQIFRSITKKQITLPVQLLLIFFAWGFGEWILVPRIAIIHDYMLIYFLPFVTLALGLVFYWFYRRNKKIGLAIFFVLVFASLLSHLNFTKALIKSEDQTTKLFYLSKQISEKTNHGDRILVIAENPNFEIRYPSHYLSFYSNRFIKYSLKKDNPNPNGFKLIVHEKNDEFKINESK